MKKDNKKIINEINRLNELMGLSKNLLNEQAWVDDLLTAVISAGAKQGDELTTAIAKLGDDALTATQKADVLEDVIRLARKEGNDKILTVINTKLVRAGGKLMTKLDDIIIKNKSLIQSGIDRGATKSDVQKILVDDFNPNTGDDILDELIKRQLRTKIGKEYDNLVSDVVDDVASTTTRTTDDAAETGARETGDDAAETGARETGDDAAETGTREIGLSDLGNTNETLEEILSRRLEDIPPLSDDFIEKFSKDPRFIDFLKKLKENNTIGNIIKDKKVLIDESQRIMDALLNNNNIGAVGKRRLEKRLNDNLLSIVNFKGDKSYKDFYRWANDLFSNSTDKQTRKWWNELKKQPGFVIFEDISKRPSLLNRIFSGYIDGWKSMKESTKNLRTRILQMPGNALRRLGNIFNYVRGKKLRYDIKNSTPEQRSAIKKYFWTGNQSGYEGFFEYMAKNGFISATSRLAGQFSRGYIMGTFAFTIVEHMSNFAFGGGGGFEGGLFGSESLKTFLKDLWDNTSGFKYVIPANTIGEPVWDLLVNDFILAGFDKNRNNKEEMMEWFEERLPFISSKIEEWFINNPETAPEEAERVVGNTGEEPDNSTESTDSEPGSLQHATEYFGDGVTQEGGLFIYDGDKYKFNGTDYEWVQ